MLQIPPVATEIFEFYFTLPFGLLYLTFGLLYLTFGVLYLTFWLLY